MYFSVTGKSPNSHCVLGSHFIVAIVVWLCELQYLPVAGRSTSFVQTEISQQLLDSSFGQFIGL